MGNNAIVHHVQLESVRLRHPSDRPLPARSIAPTTLRADAASTANGRARGRESRRSCEAAGGGGMVALEATTATLRRSSSMPMLRQAASLAAAPSAGTLAVASQRRGDVAASRTDSIDLLGVGQSRRWEAAVKRPFSLSKMLAAIENKNEAGVAKRLRMAGALNTTGRLLYFYGLGIALSSNNNNHDEYKFEATLLSQFQEDFSSYTLKRFMDDYTTSLPRSEAGGALGLGGASGGPSDGSWIWQSFTASFHGGGGGGEWHMPPEERQRIASLQQGFSLIKVKVLLVSLLNGFRDLTLMGVQAFDFNHLSNVLVSRDCRNVRLIDIDGASKGSIQFPSNYIQGAGCATQGGGGGGEDGEADEGSLHKPALDIDLATLLPLVVQQLMLGKGRGKPFVDEEVSRVRRSRSDEDAKGVIKAILRENFFPELRSVGRTGLAGLAFSAAMASKNKHLNKVVEWFFAVLMKRSPWSEWTNDIYDAMRCIDHLPVG